MKKIIKYPGFWKSVAGLTLIFIFVYNAVDVFIKFEADFSAYLEFRFASENIGRLIITNLSGGFVYGFIVTYFKFKQKVKNNNQ